MAVLPAEPARINTPSHALAIRFRLRFELGLGQRAIARVCWPPDCERVRSLVTPASFLCCCASSRDSVKSFPRPASSCALTSGLLCHCFMNSASFSVSSTPLASLPTHDCERKRSGCSVVSRDGIVEPATYYAVNQTVPVLTQVPISVSPNPCVSPSRGTGTCTITWSAPVGLSIVNGVQYRLKYLTCKTGVLTIYGNDCPAGGKTMVPALKFHSDITTTGFAAPDGSGSWDIDPSKNWNRAFTEDCLAGQSAPNCNPTTPSGTSYIFNTQPNTTYTFSLSAYIKTAAK